MPKAPSFYEVLSQAIAYFSEHGYESVEEMARWQRRLREAAEASLTPPALMEANLRDAMRAIYAKLIDRGDILKMHPGVSRFTIEKVRPELRRELDRRIMASADLIRLNRTETIEKTLRRFSGWATSIPRGGSDVVARRAENEKIRKPLANLPFESRRCLIDQGHKFTSALNEILAIDGGAIAAVWVSHYHQPGYDYREPHKERDIASRKKPFVIRGNWAAERSLMKLDGSIYTDEITKPGEEVFCRCSYKYLHNLRDLPETMLTAKGREALKQARAV